MPTNPPQRPVAQPLGVKRFYETAAVATRENSFGVVLDGRAVLTPARRPLLLPTRALAQAVAEEWETQGERLDPRAMALTRLANTAIDRIAPEPRQALDEIAAYARTDLLCYRAAEPEKLVRRQEAVWQPVLDWLQETHGARLAVVTGVLATEQPADTLAVLDAACVRYDAFRLAALHALVTLMGSSVLALALAEAQLSPEEAWAACRLDEEFQISQWGEDAEDAARTARMKAAFDAAHRFFLLAQG